MKNNCIDSLRNAGVSFEDANALRRIAMTLHRWHELECGDSNDYASWAIERDDNGDGPAYLVTHPHQGNYGWSVWCRDDNQYNGTPGDMIRASKKTFASKESALEYMRTVAPSREPEIRQILSRRTKIADKERGALKRLAAIMARYPGFAYYVQGDPRGASLYILRPGDVPTGETVDSLYTRGIAVYK